MDFKFARRVWGICYKDIKVYYMKGPIVLMGVIFPLFLWIAFYAGRGFGVREGIPSLLIMTLFFTSSSVTPVIPPWETRQKTLEMLLTRPVTITTVLAGDMAASTLFGLIFSIPPVVIGMVMGAFPNNLAYLVGMILLTSLGFSAMGMIFSALPTDIPADVILLANTIKLPLIFVSGVLIPLDKMPSWAMPIALVSPLTYPADFFNWLYFGCYFDMGLDASITVIMVLILMLVAVKLHRRTIFSRLQR